MLKNILEESRFVSARQLVYAKRRLPVSPMTFMIIWFYGYLFFDDLKFCDTFGDKSTGF